METLSNAMIRRAAIAGVAVIVAGSGCRDSVGPSNRHGLILEALSATRLEGTVAADVDPPPAVRVLDRLSNPVPGIVVRFYIIDGGGNLQRASVPTDINGVATTGWTLGPKAGQAKVGASAPGLPTILFTALVGAGAATQMLPIPRAYGNRGTAGAAAREWPSVQLRDQFDNPVKDVAVTFSVITGSGTLGKEVVTTDDMGIAAAGPWVLGRPGENTVAAAVTGLPSVTITIIAVDLPVETYALESIRLGSMPLFRLPGQIELHRAGAFTTHVGDIPGGGTYEISGSKILLNYSGDFLGRLHEGLNYEPPFASGPAGSEAGRVMDDAILIDRCWTEDCYESTWTYRKSYLASASRSSSRR